jgi:PhzF family phenazine biosynthesis protein
LLVELKDIATLWSLKPNFELIKKLVPTGIYAFVKINNHFYNARQFNPSTGVNEDPVTGVAAGALGAYLKKYYLVEMPIIVEQGHMLGKIGQIYVDTCNGIKVGGYAVETGQLILD